MKFYALLKYDYFEFQTKNHHVTIKKHKQLNMEIYILDKKLTVPVPKISLVNPKSFKRRRKLNSSLWFILVGKFCLFSPDM